MSRMPGFRGRVGMGFLCHNNRGAKQQQKGKRDFGPAAVGLSILVGGVVN